METMDVTEYIARQMGISRTTVARLIKVTNDEARETLDEGHVPDKSPEKEASLELEKEKVDLKGIADQLELPLGEFETWVSDEMVFIQYGQNLVEGIAAEGPTALSATADFYCRWYNKIIQKHGSVLLHDKKQHYYGEEGEEHGS